MNIIENGGTSSKNTLKNTKGAISLSLMNNFNDGIYLDIGKTKDNIFVVAENNKLKTTSGNIEISDKTYYELLKYNTGTKVLRSNILTLNEVLEIYKDSDKTLILKINNKINTDKLKKLIKQYPNIYLVDDDIYSVQETDTKDNLNKMINQNKKIMIKSSDIINLYYKYGKYVLDNSYIITNNPNKLLKEYNKLVKFF